MNIAYIIFISLFHFIIQLTEAGVSSHLGPNVLLNVEEELRPEPDLVPTLLLLMEVPNVQENLPRVGLVTTRSAQVSQPDSDIKLKVDFGEIRIGKIGINSKQCIPGNKSMNHEINTF